MKLLGLLALLTLVSAAHSQICGTETVITLADLQNPQQRCSVDGREDGTEVAASGACSSTIATCKATRALTSQSSLTQQTAAQSLDNAQQACGNAYIPACQLSCILSVGSCQIPKGCVNGYQTYSKFCLNQCILLWRCVITK
eukprot:TRINITY_DN5287_c0_g1_i2.p3 TRINITY_DN5287_c0_g1~~TRINITY_DN5287_c0_g1_i2.p3  ORF type:complete len:142 (-),score=3.18 TRINITY_DN5287_c0_g1_i2:366-791(-)